MDFVAPLLNPLLGPLFGEKHEPAPAHTPVQAGPDAEPQSIKDRYSSQAYAQLGLTKDQFESMDPVKRNTLITGAYAGMYENNQDTMKWAGMASFASDTVGLGMMGAPIMGQIPGGPDGDKVKELLAGGNAQLFQDIYWQHMAFEHGGMKELQEAAKAGDVDPVQLKAWQEIAEGKKALDEAKKGGDAAAIKAAQDQVWQGNGDLLAYEQQTFLQKLVYDSSPEAREAFQKMTNLTGMIPGVGMPSPIPGGDSFQEYRDDKGRTGAADVGDKDQRWDWISNSMLPSFRNLEENKHGEMMGYMDRFQANSSTGIPGIPQAPRLPFPDIPSFPSIPIPNIPWPKLPDIDLPHIPIPHLPDIPWPRMSDIELPRLGTGNPFGGLFD